MSKCRECGREIISDKFITPWGCKSCDYKWYRMLDVVLLPEVVKLLHHRDPLVANKYIKKSFKDYQF